MIRSVFPVLSVEDIDTCRDFYRDVLEMELTFECGWYTSLAVPGDVTNQVAFVLAGHPSVPDGYGLPAAGCLVTVDVDDVDEVHRRTLELGHTPVLDICDEDFGQRHFMLQDPAGVILDVIQWIRPSREFLRDIARIAIHPATAGALLDAETRRIQAELEEHRSALALLADVRHRLHHMSTTLPALRHLPVRRVACLEGHVRAEHAAADVRRLLATLRRTSPPRDNSQVSYGAVFPLDLDLDPFGVTVFHSHPQPQQNTMTVGGSEHLVLDHEGRDIEQVYSTLLDATEDLAIAPGGRVLEDYRSVDGLLITTVALELDTAGG